MREREEEDGSQQQPAAAAGGEEQEGERAEQAGEGGKGKSRRRWRRRWRCIIALHAHCIARAPREAHTAAAAAAWYFSPTQQQLAVTNEHSFRGRVGGGNGASERDRKRERDSSSRQVGSTPEHWLASLVRTRVPRYSCNRYLADIFIKQHE